MLKKFVFTFLSFVFCLLLQTKDTSFCSEKELTISQTLPSVQKVFQLSNAQESEELVKQLTGPLTFLILPLDDDNRDLKSPILNAWQVGLAQASPFFKLSILSSKAHPPTL